MVLDFIALDQLTLLAVIWSASIALAALSLITMTGLIVRRIFQDREARWIAKRKQALTHLVMIYLDAPVDDRRIREICRDFDMRLLLEVASGLFENKGRKRLLRTDLRLLSGIARDLLGSDHGASRDRLIGLLRATPAERTFLADLRDKDIGTRIRAIETLALLPGPSVIKALRGALRDRNPDVRLASARALVEFGQYVTIDDLVERLDIGGTIRSRVLRDIFRMLASRDASDIVQLLDNRPSDQIAALAIYAIGTTQDYSLVPVIARHAGWPSIDVRAEAMRALTAIGHPTAEPTVVRGLRDRSWEVRTEAAICAGRIPLPNTIPILQHNLADPEWWPRFRAAEALKAMGAQGMATLEQARSGIGPAARISDMVLADASLAA